MGKLQSIELYNFKSYRGVQRADFGTAHFTSIIGPNGSGKSNMMDAISFVLGIRSKELRSSHAKDLIYRNRVTGGENGSNGSDDTATEAYVKAVYTKSNGEEWELKRVVNARGSSDYLINNKRVSANEYAAKLAEENILIKAKNFLVFQGDVDAIAAQDPKSLCKLFEQISGAMDYKEEYDQLLAEKSQEATKQSALNQDRKRCAADVKLLVEQKQETEKYQRKLQKREDALKSHLLWRLYHCESRAEQRNAEYQDAKKHIQQAQNEFKGEMGTFETASVSHAAAKKKSLAVESKLKRQVREIENCKQDMVPLDAKAAMLESRISSEEKRREAIEREREKHQKDIKRQEKNISNSNKALEQFENEVASKLKQGFNVTESDIAEFQQLKDTYMEQTAAEQSQLSLIQRQNKTTSDELASLQSNKSQLEEKIDQLKNEVDEHSVRVSTLTSTINDDTTLRSEKKAELDEITLEERRKRQKLRTLNEKLAATLQQLSDYDAVQHESHRERTLRENGAALKRYISGVHGFVHDLVDADQEKYRTAVATVLGRHMNSIVVDTFRTGNECIAYLKDNRMPSISFIPLDTIHVRPIRGDYRGIAKGARLAIETVKFPEEVEAAVQYVCGDTIICDTIDIAKHVRWTKGAEVKTVALDGSVIHRSNLMTGGSSGASAQQWTDAKVRSLRNLQDQLKDDISQVNTNVNTNIESKLTSELVHIEARIESNKNVLAQVQEVLNSRKSELKHWSKQLSDLKPQIKAAQDQVSQFEQQIEQVESSVAGIQQEVFGSFCERVGVSNFKEFDNNQQSVQQQVARERTRHEQQIKRLEQLLAAAKDAKKEQDSRLERKDRAIHNDRESLRALQHEKQELVHRLGLMEAKRDELAAENEKYKLEIEGHKRTAKELKDRLQGAEKELEKTRQAAELIRQEMHSYISTRVNIFRDCRMEGTEVPLIEGSLDDIPLDIDEVQPDEADENGDESMPDADAADTSRSFGVVVDYSNLDEEFKEEGSDAAEVGQRLLNQAEELAADMENIRQKVDLHAGQKLEERRARLKELEAEFAALQRRTKEANARFNQVSEKRYDTFMKAYNHISMQIETTYRELTSSPNVPKGGTASMYLENPEEPWNGGINYGAMPPLKRYQPMELLSGGEKTMTAMALLFAIHSFRPSPFFVLDEIDAALDNANVSSIARYINKHCGDNFQFIVISLKQGLFEHSHSLVGIHRNQVENSSKALMIDLRS